MKTLLKTLGVLAGMVALGVALTYGMLHFFDYKKSTTKKTSSLSSAAVLANSEVKAEDAKMMDNGNYSLPNSEFNTNFTWKDTEVQIALHEMAHQKVKADQKWGFIMITQERIESLLGIVKTSNMNHKNTYMEILERWKQGKYETVDDDHNAIWKLQSGNLGEGKGVMSPEEQKELVQKVFMQKETFSGSTLIAGVEQVEK
ncbi:PRK06770 family protein [Bacillus sp. DX1.1]|uniref:PRK06770 family protein n=1 Tax=unclassified Bacillus (in: firmicutes) TaxID=185979 RepID=UPI002570E379|nr:MULTISPECIES: PRK06770 family protein [unclassified Bacillus (in: firmicutes)]MDM5154933.1 PRK06770 family protein [Bacillus sp. DX1.1]WJE83799.1 PRK06770 family protein [Bacillus sp. DX3.1]